MRALVLGFLVAAAIGCIGTVGFTVKSAGPALAATSVAIPVAAADDCDENSRCVDITRPLR